MYGCPGLQAVPSPTGASLCGSASTGNAGHNLVPLQGVMHMPPQSMTAQAASGSAQHRICPSLGPSGSSASTPNYGSHRMPSPSISPSPLIMRTPWRQAFFEEYGEEYDSDFERGGGPYAPGSSHQWERCSCSNTSSPSDEFEWVFNRRDHTTPLPCTGNINPSDSPLRHRVSNLDLCDASPQLMACGPRALRGNHTTDSRKPTRTHCAQQRVTCGAPEPLRTPRPAAKAHI